MQIYADVLAARSSWPKATNPLRSAPPSLGALASGTNGSGPDAVRRTIGAMARQRPDLVYRPNAIAVKQYDKLYKKMYRTLARIKG